MSKILEELARGVFAGDVVGVTELSEKAHKEGISAADIITKGLSEGMNQATRFYRSKGMYLDRTIWAAAAFQFGMASISDYLEKEKMPPLGKVVLGVMCGPWTIGTNLVLANLKAANFEAIDAGSDVSPKHIAECAKKENADIICVGLYLSYRIHRLKELEEELFRLGIRQKVKTILSGPSANRKIARECGFDAYAKDAISITETAKRFLKEKAASKKVAPEMTPIERIRASLNFKEPDRVPLVPFSMTFSAKFAKIPYSVFCKSGEAMAEAQIKAVREFGWDGVTTCSDVARFAEPLGAKVNYPEDDVPRLVEGAIRLATAREDFERLKKEKPEYYARIGRAAETVKAVKIIKDELGDECAVIGSSEGPFQGTMLALGADPAALFLTKQDPGLLHEILAWYVEYEVAIAKELIAAGADLIFSGEPASYWMSPEMFKEFAYPYQKDAYRRITEAGALPLIHCCGNVPQSLPFAPEVCPGGVVNFDYNINLKWAKKLIGDRITIMGNLDCNRLLHLGSIADVEEASIKAIKAAAKGGGFWLSGGCEIPRDMTYRNMQAMLRVCQTAGKYPIDLD
jgi:MtaA/CmuA family methyltransferase